LRANNGHDQPIRIVQVGRNDYAIFIAGTDADDHNVGKNDWFANLHTGEGNPSKYSDQVKKYIEASLRDGANIHFVGHSQGGYVANLLANDSELANNFSISSVTTFASAGVVPYNSQIGVENYHNYITENDPIRRHQEFVNWPTIFEFIFFPRLSLYRIRHRLSLSGFGTSLVAPEVIPSNLGASGSDPSSWAHGHTTYYTSPELANKSLPFDIDPNYVGQFDRTFYADHPEFDMLADIEEGLRWSEEVFAEPYTNLD